MKLDLIYQNYAFFSYIDDIRSCREKKDSKKDLIEKKSYRPTTTFV